MQSMKAGRENQDPQKRKHPQNLKKTLFDTENLRHRKRKVDGVWVCRKER